MPSDTPVTVLVVDDSEGQRIALSAILAELNVAVVEATSGREALRRLLEQDFAIILLDVNMPGLDGFETAALIRERPRSEHTPIIFITAYSDDAYALRGYSLGAVDYILAPVQPDVLRAKVAVFIDLYTKTEQIKRQREDLRRYASQLQQLSEASLAINSAQSIEEVSEIVAGTAAKIIGANQVSTSALRQDGSTSFIVTHVAEPNGGPPAVHTANRLLDPLGPTIQQSVRLSAAELQATAAWETSPRALIEGIPMRGWLAAPLTGRSGRSIGYIQLSDKAEGEFGAEDQGILVQLSQMVSIAIENIQTRDAREANRLKDEFLGVLSHELRTPLQAMLTWIAILRETVDAKTVARGLEVIERSAKTQSQLIEDLLDVSRIIHGQLCLEISQVELGRVIEQAIETLRPSATAKNIKIVRPPSTAGCRTVGDATRIQQVLWNLMSNAIKFTPEGGRVEIRLIEESERVGIQVHDSGRGIPVEFLPHVFERFRQAHSGIGRQHGGLGLGLAIVHHLVELHGGTVEAANAPGGGAVFTVMLPRAPQAPEQVTSPAHPGDEQAMMPPNGVRLDGIRVVLVEDENDTRECLATGLRLFGAKVVAVDSVAAALKALDLEAPDVLLSDVAMPGQDGHALIRLIRERETERGGRLPAAALTAHVRPEDRASTLLSGFDMHIGKPVQPLDLATAVQDLAGRMMGKNGSAKPRLEP